MMHFVIIKLNQASENVQRCSPFATILILVVLSLLPAKFFSQNMSLQEEGARILSFSAEPLPDSRAVSLKWTCTCALSNNGFEVLRSTDGKGFSKIGWIRTICTDRKPLDFRFTDDSVSFGQLYFYKLKQLDIDDTYVYSDLLEVRVMARDLVRFGDLYPNPVEREIHLKVIVAGPCELTFSLYNPFGNRVFGETVQLLPGMDEVKFDPGRLEDGVYQVILQWPEHTESRHIFLRK
jgi:hypothetical protein